VIMDIVERLASHARLAVLLSLMEGGGDPWRRYVVLRLLSRVPGRAASASLIEELAAEYGQAATRDQVVATLAWLDRADLALMTDDDGVIGALILDLGRDVATGRVVVPGVAPAPTLAWLQTNLAAKALRLPEADLRDHLFWLAERGLIDCDDGPDLVVTITRKGADVASGRAALPGVKAPSSATIMRLATAAARGRLGG